MNLWVTSKTVSNAGVTYTLADGTAPAGTVRVNYNHKKSYWKAQGTNGLLITDESTRRAMYKAVRRFDDAALFLPCDVLAYSLVLSAIPSRRHTRNRRGHRNN